MIGKMNVNDIANMYKDKRDENLELLRQLEKLKKENEKLRECVEVIAGKGGHNWFLGRLEDSPIKRWIGLDEVIIANDTLKQLEGEK